MSESDSMPGDKPPNLSRTKPLSMEHLEQWIGKTSSSIDTVTVKPVVGLAATLDHHLENVQPGHPLIALWHWLYFLPMARRSEIGDDGHPEKGGFLPPVPLPRRMWAGSQLEFHQPIRVGDTIERVSRIENVSHKTGKSGELVFVRVKHQIDCIEDGNNTQSKPDQAKRTTAITEYHDIVYRAPPRADAPTVATKAAPSIADWEHRVEADDVLLFRYSALTFNGHRIHYDRRYVTEVEGYPGLIVHGPLIATLLIDAMNRELDGPVITHFEFKAIKPIFDINPFYVCGAADGNKVHLWAKDHLGDLTMDAVATIA